jgi:hypothetical protein
MYICLHTGCSEMLCEGRWACWLNWSKNFVGYKQCTGHWEDLVCRQQWLAEYDYPYPCFYRVHNHLPKFVPSKPYSTTLWAALLVEKRAVPPYWWGVLGGEVQLCDQLTCWWSHHSWVLEGSFPLLGAISSPGYSLHSQRCQSPILWCLDGWCPLLICFPQ